MRAGFIVERESPLSLWIYGSGIYRTPDEGGVIGGRLAVKTYACPEYGYIEQYIRYLEKDRASYRERPQNSHSDKVTSFQESLFSA